MSDITANIHALPPIAETLREHRFATKRSMGQNFIFDLNVTSRIVRHAGDLKGCVVIEVGPGAGSLSRPILLAQPLKLIAVEKDRTALPLLTSLQNAAGDIFEIMQADALEVDYRAISAQYSAPLKVIANLPYNVGTELLLGWLENADMFESLTLMFQREVAERICAAPGSKDYGRLSIVCQLLCKCHIEFDVPPTVFIPPPKVYSSVVTLIPHKQPLFGADVKKVEIVTRSAFSQRRKSIRNSLKAAFGDRVEDVLTKLALDPNLRAENLTLEQYSQLAAEL